MKTIKDAIKHLSSMGEYVNYQFVEYDDSIIIATTDDNYRDLSAWKKLEFDMLTLFRSNMLISSVTNHSLYETGISTWNKEMCFLKFRVNFLNLH